MMWTLYLLASLASATPSLTGQNRGAEANYVSSVTASAFFGDVSHATGFPAPSGSAGGDLTGTYPNPTVAAGKIDTAKLGADAVDSTKILDGAVNTAKHATDSVTNVKILTAAVDTRTLASDTVSNVKILDSAVQTSKIAPDAVGTAQILNAAVTSAKVNSTIPTIAGNQIFTGQNGISSAGSLTMAGSSFTLTGAGGNFKSGSSVTASGLFSNQAIISDNVGIGTVSPCSTCTLHVAGNISAKMLNGMAFEYAATNDATCSGGASCALSSYSIGISSVSWQGTGSYKVAFKANVFSSAPTCTVTSMVRNLGQFANMNDTCASEAAGYYCPVFLSVGETGTNGGFHIICVGPR